MPFLAVEGTELYYERHGSGPAIVFAHGAGGNHLSWWQQVPVFADRYTCVVFDHRGFGQSKCPTPQVETHRFIDDLARLIDHLDLGPVVLVGQSMGGWTSLGYALARPERVRSVVMSATPGGLQSPEILAAREAALVERRAVESRGIDPAAGERMLREQPTLAFLYAEIRRLNPRLERPYLLAFLDGISRVEPEQARSIGAPVLFLTGEDDIIFPSSMIDLAAGLVPGARVVRLPAAGHSIYFERPAEFNRLLEEFVSD